MADFLVTLATIALGGGIALFVGFVVAEIAYQFHLRRRGSP